MIDLCRLGTLVEQQLYVCNFAVIRILSQHLQTFADNGFYYEPWNYEMYVGLQNSSELRVSSSTTSKWICCGAPVIYTTASFYW